MTALFVSRDSGTSYPVPNDAPNADDHTPTLTLHGLELQRVALYQEEALHQEGAQR